MVSLPASASTLPPRARVYCNRNLRLDRIRAIGFDMDYTLAIYHQREIDRLSIQATVEKLVARGYPERLLSMDYRTDFPVRGLLVDKKLGNVVKMDRHHYVRRAYHGFRPLDRDERRRLYRSGRIRPHMKRYHWVDTLYGLSEVAVYAAVIHELERNSTRLDYEELFQAVRDCIDVSHQDGSILDHILRDPERYVLRDLRLGPTLHKLKSSGKKLFLLTNSQGDYTESMMSYLLDGAVPGYSCWKSYFDLSVCDSRKPSFFVSDREFTDPVSGEAVAPTRSGPFVRGGNIRRLEAAIGYHSDDILYVGDHIYGDVLRAKKESAWRTAMIVQEMTTELEALVACSSDLERSDALHDLHRSLVREVRQLENREKRHAEESAAVHVSSDAGGPGASARDALERTRSQLAEVDRLMAELEHEIDRRFHPFWGSLFKAGSGVSLFGSQVESYACVYTDRVSNLLDYSTDHYFRSPRDLMPHEL